MRHIDHPAVVMAGIRKFVFRILKALAQRNLLLGGLDWTDAFPFDESVLDLGLELQGAHGRVFLCR